MNPTLSEKTRYNFCGQHLTIPTQLTGQNATLVKQNVKLAVQGCTGVMATKTKKLTNAQKLARALTACRKSHPHARAQRARCERKARKRYASTRRVHAKGH
jgi:hypothetical protein